MKNLINKVRHHGKKITIHLKRHHRKYLFGALCSGILALIAVHTASTVNNIFANTYDQELEQWFIYAKNRWLTDAEDIDNANLFDSVSKIELADIISNYSINILNLELDDTKGCDLPSDVSGELNAEYHSWYTNLCQLWILIETWVDFNPTDIWTKAIFWTWLSRALNANNTGLLGELNSIEPYYSWHLNWLYEQELLDNIENSGASVIKGYLFVYLMRSDKTLPICNIEYSTTWLTNQNVTAYLTWCSEENITCINCDTWTINEHIFTESGNFTFEFRNVADNTGNASAEVTWIDKNVPTCNVAYDVTWTTTWNVTAYLTWCSEENITCINCDTWTTNQHVFTASGNFTFNFRDAAGNTGSTGATVTWIDKTKPTCNVAYSTTWWTNKNVIASLTGCSETIAWTNLQHTFTGNWTYTFEFQDLLGNTWRANAIVSWITGNTTYINVEWYEFTWNDLAICNPDNSRECITMMDRNLWATTNDINNTWSYGYHYQRGNNYGFNPFESIEITTGKAIWNNEYNNKWYYNTKFIVWNNEIWAEYREDEVVYSWGHNIYNYHDWIWWWYYDNNGNNRWAYSNNYKDRQWPCPDGYHVPSAGERWLLVKYYIDTYASGIRLYEWDSSSASIWGDWLYYFSDTGTRLKFQKYFKIPFAWSRYRVDGSLEHLGYFGNYRSSSSLNGGGNTINFTIRNSDVWKVNWYRIRTEWESVRCFKNNTWHNSADNGVSFSISIDDTIKAWENSDFVVKVMRNWTTLRNYTGTVYFELTDRNWNTVDRDLYEFSEGKRYKFNESDRWRKTFSIKIKKEWTYILKLYDSDNENIEWSEIITVRANGSNSSSFEYDTLKFNPNYSNEMNKAYQYARYYDITTIDSIKQANMTGWLNRIAMAKMLANYAENVLWIDDFNTSRNCTFSDVSTSLDRQYDYWVTKACQLWIMWVNMKDNKFYPNWWVTRAEFATALSRLLYNTKDWANKYYSTHISKLYNEWIITNTDPTLKEKRWYVMLMLMRAEWEYDD